MHFNSNFTNIPGMGANNKQQKHTIQIHFWVGGIQKFGGLVKVNGDKN